MDRSIHFLREALEEAKVGDRSKLQAFNRLRSLLPKGSGV